jgi:hypothetical protein
MAGHVVTAAHGPVRVLVAPALRAGRHLELLRGLSTGVVASLVPAHGMTEPADDAIRTLGEAFSMGAFSPVVRRTLLGESAATAERHARIGRASWLLRLRWRAAMAQVWLQEGFASAAEVLPSAVYFAEAAKEALTVGMEPSDLLPQLARLPPWPGGWRLRTRGAEEGRSVMRGLWAARIAWALREQFDEVFPLFARSYEPFAQAAPALAAGAIGVDALYGVSDASSDALSNWVKEFL